MLPNYSKYLQGKPNVLADTFSRLPRFDSLEIIEGKSDMENMPVQDPISVTYGPLYKY